LVVDAHLIEWPKDQWGGMLQVSSGENDGV
jgi:hypothetical protein